MKLRLLLLTVIFSTVGFIAHAKNTLHPPLLGEENTKKSDIAGGVIEADTKKPIGNVSVTAYSTTRKEKIVLTDGSGNYSFNELKPGTYKLVFEKLGYKKVTKDKVTIKLDEGCQLNVEMDEEKEFHIMPGQLFSDFE